jgi:hypothetical protein
MEVDVKTYDTVGAMKKYGYTFDDDTDVPKRRALLVGLVDTYSTYRCAKRYIDWHQRKQSDRVAQ